MIHRFHWIHVPNIFGREKGMNCLYFALHADVFVAKSGCKSEELLLCGSFQREHYSSLLFHVVFLSRLSSDYSLTLMIFVQAIQHQYKG